MLLELEGEKKSLLYVFFLFVLCLFFVGKKKKLSLILALTF